VDYRVESIDSLKTNVVTGLTRQSVVVHHVLQLLGSYGLRFRQSSFGGGTGAGHVAPAVGAEDLQLFNRIWLAELPRALPVVSFRCNFGVIITVVLPRRATKNAIFHTGKGLFSKWKKKQNFFDIDTLILV
jgi:hypothetical protein